MVFMATTNATHDTRGHMASVMPRISEATATTVYAVDARNTVCERCIRCGTWAPIWNPHGDNKIRIGSMVRMHNPNLGRKMANGAPDERAMLMFPKTKTGHGCPACVEAFTAVMIARPSAREPFLPMK